MSFDFLIKFVICLILTNITLQTEDLNFRAYYCLMIFSKSKDLLVSKFTKEIVLKFSNTTDIQQLSNQYMLTLFSNCFKRMEAFSDIEVYGMVFGSINNSTTSNQFKELDSNIDFISEIQKPGIDQELILVQQEIQIIQGKSQVELSG